MSNTSNQMGNRGSKLCMQICVNNVQDDIQKGKIVRKSRKHLLDDLIGKGSITWFSPLSKENFKEYKLKDIAKNYPKETGLNNMEFKSKIQSQWDAVGVAEDGTLILVEAKAHTKEIKSSYKGTPKSRIQIKQEIEEVMGTDPVWMDGYYQTANRIFSLSKLKQYFGEERDVLLVFLNFINDVSYKPEPKEMWDKFLQNMKKEHPLPTSLSDSIKYIYMDIWKDKGV